MKQLAFFGELTYDLTDKWSVTGGARWFEYDREMFDKYHIPLGLPASSDPDANGLLSTGKDSDTTFKFATKYQFNPDVMVYALYSEGFRLGGQNSLRAAETGPGAARRTGRTTWRTTRWASRASGSTTGCNSTCRRS